MRPNSSLAASKANPPKAQLIAWINSLTPASVPKIKDIGELGNGAAYLFILENIYPGSVKLDKVVKSANTPYDIRNNLLMLLTAFQKLKLPFRLDIDKLSQKKYLDNYHLTVYLFKLSKTAKENLNQQTPCAEEKQPKKYRVVMLEGTKPVPLVKNPPPPVTPQDLINLKPESNVKRQKLKPEGYSEEEEAKLNKIKSVLKMQQSSGLKKRPENPNNDKSANSLSLEESYKRLLRSTVCQQSKYLSNSFAQNEKEKQKVEAPKRQVQLLVNKEIQWEVQSEMSMLLSSKKKVNPETYGLCSDEKDHKKEIEARQISDKKGKGPQMKEVQEEEVTAQVSSEVRVESGQEGKKMF